MNILDIQNPKFLKKLKKKELEQLSTDIRQFLIEKISKKVLQKENLFAIMSIYRAYARRVTRARQIIFSS